MKIWNPNELVGKEVFDANGTSVGWVDKTWNSWNEEYPGYFFGVKTNEHVRNTHFRGANKLIPIYNEYIRTTGNTVTLNKTIDELCHYWNTTVPCGPTQCPIEELVEMPVYDKFHSRIGTFCTYVETNGTINNFGLLPDPYLCESLHLPYNTTFPIETNYITLVKDTVTLDKTLHELKDYWQYKRQR
ncbi:MAG: PRC-barrel domain-containing protein [Euryarchaeota archaeon]|nr:PRC-barrel domain-containing protein [Euryarchaeota archaeon]